MSGSSWFGTGTRTTEVSVVDSATRSGRRSAMAMAVVGDYQGDAARHGEQPEPEGEGDGPAFRDPARQVRIASNTKMYTATVVLRLVGEGKIDLDAPIETYLPNLVRGDGSGDGSGNGADGRDITVRQTLQHPSGLADYDDIIVGQSASRPVGQDHLAVQHTHFEPRELLDAVLAKKALFAPGTGWSYSNVTHLLARSR
ncbi:serine hydrolase [Actinophytocola sp.]|uniref:serine hydrolase domain-containing protein n=1 Tax=Actinophytocola sp. TaxID=1872138 RepID=UPI0025C4DB3B|nr:serine hydrolase domain-containing protein [Actinophytocola sp.]